MRSRTLALSAAVLIGLAAGSAWLGAAQQAQAPPPLGRIQADQDARRAGERIRELQREAESLAAQERTLLVELRQLEVARDLRAQELVRVEAELTATTADLSRTEEETRQLQALVRAQQPGVAARMVELYKLGRAGYWRLLLNVDDIRAFGRAYRSVSTLARLDQERVTQHRHTLASLSAARASLQTRRAEMQALQGGVEKARLSLERAAAEYELRVGELDQRRDLNARLAGELQSAQERLQATVGALGGGPPASTSLPIAPFRGELDWPVDGRLVAPFGRQVPSRFGALVRRNGIEIAGREGEPVLAVHDGAIAFAGPFTGFGNLVIVDHGEQAYSLYGYLSSLEVSKGMTVGRGAELGTIGRPPGGDTPQLYFELRIDGKPVDPVEWLRKR